MGSRQQRRREFYAYFAPNGLPKDKLSCSTSTRGTPLTRVPLKSPILPRFQMNSACTETATEAQPSGIILAEKPFSEGKEITVEKLYVYMLGDE